MYKKVGSFIGILITLILIFILTINLILIYTGKKDSSFLGYTTAIVLTGSMEDAISIGDLIVIKDKESYKQNDIITFREGNIMVTHRIVEVTENGFITKGDANNTPDDEIKREQVEGKVVFIIPKMGLIIDKIRTPLGALALSSIIILVYFIPVRKKGKD